MAKLTALGDRYHSATRGEGVIVSMLLEPWSLRDAIWGDAIWFKRVYGPAEISPLGTN